jgi:serine/threonine protein kinase/tetratricopeptide (TPR) repeat protein
MSLKEARALFEECVELPPADREARLAACGDPELREQVRALLRANVEVESSGTDPFAPLRLPPRPPPERIGAYRVLERLGEGAMGEVLLAAQDVPVRRQVAIKVIKAGMDTREVIARFELERQTLALMSHANVARMLDAGATDSGRPYFVMEYVAGIPITRYCDDRRLDVPGRLRLFMQVCAGVQHAHHRGIIHRDLKPSNALVTEIDGEPVPKIIDFGIAKATTTTENSPHTRLGHLLGTPGYMSPEQAELSPLDVDTRTDVYSLGALLYELLTGRLPLEVDTNSVTPAALARELSTRDVERPSRRVLRDDDGVVERAERRGRMPRRLSAELSGDLDWIVLKALARDRRHRYDSAAELCRDVERHLSTEPVIAGPPSASYRIGKFVRRHRVIAASTAALVVASIAFGSAMLVQARETALQRDRAETEAATAREVSALLTGLFSAVDPSASRGRNVTARELLDTAAATLKRDASVSPLVRARLQSSIGEVYRSLGLKDQAYEQFSGALALLADRPVDDVDRLRAERGVGSALIYLTRYDEAERRLVPALEIVERKYGKSHRLYGDLTNDMGSLRYYQGKYQEALRWTEESYRARVVERGPGETETLSTLANIGVIRSQMGDEAGAIADFQETIRLTRQYHGEGHPAMFRPYTNLSGIYGRAGRHEIRVKLYEEVLPMARRVYGDTHPETLSMLGNYASVLNVVGRNAEALAIHRDVYEKIVASLGIDSREAMVWETHLAHSLGLNGRHEESERLFTTLLARQERKMGAGNFDTLNTRNAWSDVLALQGRHERVLQVAAPVPELARRNVGPRSNLIRTALVRLADSSFALGRDADARRYWGELTGFKVPGDLKDYPQVAKRLKSGDLQPPADASSTRAVAAR